MLLASATASTAIAQVAPAASTPAVPPSAPLSAKDVAVRLMVMREVSTKVARPGDRFPLSVQQDVTVDGVRLIAAGTPGQGEVVAASESGAFGKSGKLSVRLLYLQTAAGQVPLRADITSAGPGGAGTTAAATVLMALAGGGPLGLLTRGVNAKLKAGDIVDGYVAVSDIRSLNATIPEAIP